MLKQLELRIPPPIVLILCGIYVFAIRGIAPLLPLEFSLGVMIGGVFAILGIALDFIGVRTFAMHKTTINPLSPNHSSSIVRDGIYKYTRNPMYLGMVLILLGWCIMNHSVFGFLAIPAFIKYIETFQIIPEEKILKAKFGAEYDDYLNNVRRWF